MDHLHLGVERLEYANQIEPAVKYGLQYVDVAAELLGRAEETAPYRS